MEEYKSTVVNVVSQDLEQSPDKLKNTPLKNSKFNTLDKKTKDWVLTQFSRVSSSTSSETQDNLDTYNLLSRSGASLNSFTSPNSGNTLRKVRPRTSSNSSSSSFQL